MNSASVLLIYVVKHKESMFLFPRQVQGIAFDDLFSGRILQNKFIIRVRCLLRQAQNAVAPGKHSTVIPFSASAKNRV
jgi:hypothetical protein